MTTSLLLALVAPAGCSTAGVQSEPSSKITAPPATPALLRFADAGTITLGPGEARAVVVVASPPARYQVRFSLLGDVIDGWLDSAVVTTGSDGVGQVKLHAPNQATTFHLRASILDDSGEPGPSAEVGVAVSDLGFGSLRVLPQYTGQRTVEGWTASVVARTTCADIAASLPGEAKGSLTAMSGPNGTPLIENAPVGPNLAVTVRAGHFAWGCADTADLKAGGKLDVKVPVFDKPIDLGATDLDLALGFSPNAADYSALLAGSTAELSGAFIPPGAKESAVLLDAMAASLPADQTTGFDTERAEQGWDDLASQHFAALPISLGDQVAAWLGAGLPAQAPHITATLQGQPGVPGLAAVVVKQLGSVDAAAAGIPAESPFTWSADADDKLILGGIVLWQPSRYLGAVAFASAQQAVPTAATMPDALAAAADCAGLSTTLGGFPDCDVTCTASLCHAALEALWTGALSASTDSGLVGHISVTATGPALIDDAAEPLGFSGQWVGTVSNGVLSAEVKGTIFGGSPGLTPPPM